MNKSYIVLKNGFPQWWIICSGKKHLKRVLDGCEKGEVHDILVCTDEDSGAYRSIIDFENETVVVDGEVLGKLP